MTTILTRENLKEINNLAELLDLRYGKKGTPSREAFEQSVKELRDNMPLKLL